MYDGVELHLPGFFRVTALIRIDGISQIHHYTVSRKAMLLYIGGKNFIELIKATNSLSRSEALHEG